MSRETGPARRRRALLVGIVIAGLVGAVATWAAMRDGPQEHMAAYVAELRARGEPGSLADLDAPLPADDDNGAPELESALAWLDRRLERASDEVDAHAWWLGYVGPWNYELADPWHEHSTPEQLDALRALLDTCGPFFEQMQEATSRREIAWPRSALSTDMSSFGPVLSTTWSRGRQVLEVQARVASSREERERALVSLLRLDRRVRRRMTIDHLVGAVARKHGCALLRDGVEEGRIDAVSIRPHCDDLLRGGTVTRMPNLLRVHRAQSIDFFPELLDGSANATLRSAARLMSGAGGAKPSRWEQLQDAVADKLAGVSFPWREFLVMVRDVDTVIPEDDVWTPESERALAAYATGWGGDAAALLRICRMLRAADAADSLARVALAACEHRAVHGTWPASCTELAPLFPGGVPLDPYTDQPFAMEHHGETLVIRAQPPDGVLLGKDDTPRSAALVWRLPGR